MNKSKKIWEEILAEWEYQYWWIWKFLITWRTDFSVGYYPDYETNKWEISFPFRRWVKRITQWTPKH